MIFWGFGYKRNFIIPQKDDHFLENNGALKVGPCMHNSSDFRSHSGALVTNETSLFQKPIVIFLEDNISASVFKSRPPELLS